MTNDTLQLFNKSNDLEMIHIFDILYVEECQKHNNFITMNETYHHTFDFEQLLDSLEDFNFMKSNRGIYVNVPRLKKYDCIDMWLYFEDVVTEASIKAPVGQNYISKYKKLLGRLNSVDYMPQLNMRSLVRQS